MFLTTSLITSHLSSPLGLLAPPFHATSSQCPRPPIHLVPPAAAEAPAPPHAPRAHRRRAVGPRSTGETTSPGQVESVNLKERSETPWGSEAFFKLSLGLGFRFFVTVLLVTVLSVFFSGRVVDCFLVSAETTSTSPPSGWSGEALQQDLALAANGQDRVIQALPGGVSYWISWCVF